MRAFYLDEDVSERLTEALLALGLDATSVSRLRHKGLKDPQQLLIAANLNRVLITYNNDDFELLHEAWHTWTSAWGASAAARHSGILLIYPGKDITIIDIAHTIHRFAESRAEIDNRLFAWNSVDDWHERPVARPSR